jgi:multiple sugar transport system permease protein
MVTTDAPARSDTRAARAAASGAPSRNRRPAPPRGGAAGTVLVNAALVVASAYFLLPIAWVLIAATKSPGDLYSTFGLWFSDRPQAWQNLVALFTQDDGAFSVWILNSILYSGVGALVATVISTAAGYAFAKYDFPAKEVVFWTILGGVLVPATVIALPLYFLLNSVSLTGTYWSVLLPCMVSPFGVFLARIHANASVPDEVIEAARIDGAGEFRIFFRIALRMIAPGFVTVLLFQLVATWNNYFLPLIMLNDPDLYPFTVGLASWASQSQGGGGSTGQLLALVVTGSMLSIIPLIAAFLMLSRYWQSGLTAGGVKQ